MAEIKPIKGQGVIPGKAFVITEANGTKTWIYQEQGLDLVVAQRRPGSRKVFMQHYSDPGINFFAILLKYLYENKIPFKREATREKRKQDEFRWSARIASMSSKIPFPLRHPYYLPDSPPAIVSIQSKGGKPHLEFKEERQTISISPEVAQLMVTHIPKLNPQTTAFRQLMHLMKFKYRDKWISHPETSMPSPGRKESPKTPQKKRMRRKP